MPLNHAHVDMLSSIPGKVDAVGSSSPPFRSPFTHRLPKEVTAF